MGAISDALAAAAVHHGAEIQTDAEVQSIVLTHGAGSWRANGRRRRPRGACCARESHGDLHAAAGGPEEALPSSFLAHVRAADYSCGAMKINLALDALPRFTTHPREMRCHITGTATSKRTGRAGRRVAAVERGHRARSPGGGDDDSDGVDPRSPQRASTGSSSSTRRTSWRGTTNSSSAVSPRGSWRAC